MTEIIALQNDPNSLPIIFKGGIPDPWAEYLIWMLRKKLRHEMPKEDVNIVKTLKKHYRLYLGIKKFLLNFAQFTAIYENLQNA